MIAGIVWDGRRWVPLAVYVREQRLLNPAGRGRDDA